MSRGCRTAETGLTVFSPIAHSHPIAQFGMPTSWEFWSQMDHEYLSRCNVLAVLTLPGWRESIGVQAEFGLARELGLPVVYLAPSDLDASDCQPLTLEKLMKRHNPPDHQAA